MHFVIFLSKDLLYTKEKIKIINDLFLYIRVSVVQRSKTNTNFSFIWDVTLKNIYQPSIQIRELTNILKWQCNWKFGWIHTTSYLAFTANMIISLI